MTSVVNDPCDRHSSTNSRRFLWTRLPSGELNSIIPAFEIYLKQPKYRTAPTSRYRPIASAEIPVFAEGGLFRRMPPRRSDAFGRIAETLGRVFIYSILPRRILNFGSFTLAFTGFRFSKERSAA